MSDVIDVISDTLGKLRARDDELQRERVAHSIRVRDEMIAAGRLAEPVDDLDLVSLTEEHRLITRAIRFLRRPDTNADEIALDGEQLLEDSEGVYRSSDTRLEKVPTEWRAAVEAKIERACAAAPTEVKKNKGGRRPKYNWLALSLELMRHANGIDGLRTREEICEVVHKYIVNWPEQPEGSQVREFVGWVCDTLNISR